jgi:hypothetical protein
MPVLLGPREDTPTGNLLHPEWVAGRRLWMDSTMSGLIDKLHNGDPVRGWAGDPRLAVYWAPPSWELWRLEHDGEYRLVWRGAPGTPFDERLIDMLIAADRYRRSRSLHDEIVANNEARDAEKTAYWDSYMAEEAVPRLAKALRREEDWER